MPVIMFAAPVEAKAFSPSVDNVVIGLYYGSNALAGANLENVSGSGSGYTFGYIDSRRNFVSIGASTSLTKISMTVDKNVYYNSSSGNYEVLGSTSQNTVVGCYHIQLEKTYGSYSAARSAADTFTSVWAFPKYYNDNYYVCVGAYTSRSDAESAASKLTINQGYSITAGSSYTVTVLETGTSKIIFEFDCGSSKSLVVKPSGASKTLTWFKQKKYYGMFQYRRVSGGDLTVTNVLDVEDYIKCSIPYEMVPSWPIEALKAQAVSARTYVMSHLNTHSSYGFDVCNTAHCQMYSGTERCTDNTDAAVDQTKSQYLTYNGTLCNTFYCSSNGGATENSENVWSEAFPYLIGKPDPYEATIADSIPNYYYTKTYTGAELTSLLKGKGYSCSNIISCEVTAFTKVGNVYTVTLTDDTGRTFSFSKANARTIFSLKSQRYTITNNGSGGGGKVYVDSSGSYISGNMSDVYAVGGDGSIDKLVDGNSVYAATGSGTVKVNISSSDGGQNDDNTVYTISGSGNGHNVGLSQYGAYSMAKYHNKNYIDILTFYYDGTEISVAQ